MMGKIFNKFSKIFGKYHSCLFAQVTFVISVPSKVRGTCHVQMCIITLAIRQIALQTSTSI